MNKDTERKIAEGLQQGSRQAWVQLYEAYAERIWKNIARLMGYDCPSVMDVVQETFLAAARSAKNFDSRRGTLWMWLWGIARRQIALFYRKQGPKIVLAQTESWRASLDTQKVDLIDENSVTPSELLEARELAVLVRYTLSQLSGEYQTLLLAKYVDDQPISKIATDIDSNSIAVRSKLARARKAFRTAFRKLIQSMPDEMEVLL